MKRNRFVCFAIATLLIFASLGSRWYAAYLPHFVSTYAGDTLWAMAGFFVLGMLFPRAPALHLAATAALLGLSVELSQLWQADFLQAIRATRFGGLMLGHGFLWSDLVCYALGIATGLLVEALVRKCRTRFQPPPAAVPG